MEKLTLVEIVQDILNDMSGDYIESITDTEEAEQVANIVKSTYRSILSNRNWRHTHRLLKLNVASDSSKPTHASIADDLKELTAINYDKNSVSGESKKYRPVKYIENDDFLRHCNSRNSTASNVDTVLNDNGVELFIYNDKQPDYYTSFNDKDIIFDSYDSDVDATIQASKIQAMGYVYPDFEMSDTHVPDLPNEGFSLLVEESKSKASLKLRQVPDNKAEQESARQNRWLSRKGWSINNIDIYPNYGRKGRK